MFVNTASLALYNRYRIKKILNYISVFRGNVLSEQQFRTLLNQYTSVWRNLSFFPDRKLYTEMYMDQEYLSFYSTSKRITICLYLGAIISYVLILATLY